MQKKQLKKQLASVRLRRDPEDDNRSGLGWPLGQNLTRGTARLCSRKRDAQQYLDDRGHFVRTHGVVKYAIEPEKTLLRFNFRHCWIDNHEYTSSVLRNCGSKCVHRGQISEIRKLVVMREQIRGIYIDGDSAGSAQKGGVRSATGHADCS